MYVLPVLITLLTSGTIELPDGSPLREAWELESSGYTLFPPKVSPSLPVMDDE